MSAGPLEARTEVRSFLRPRPSAGVSTFEECPFLAVNRHIPDAVRVQHPTAAKPIAVTGASQALCRFVELYDVAVGIPNEKEP